MTAAVETVEGCPRCGKPEVRPGIFECGERYIDGSYRGSCKTRRKAIPKPDVPAPELGGVIRDERVCETCLEPFVAEIVTVRMGDVDGGEGFTIPMGPGPRECPACREKAEEEERIADAQRTADGIRRAREALVPKRWQHARIEHFPDATQRWAGAYTADRSLYLYGDPDAGKTHLAAAMVLRLVTSPHPGFAWVNVPHLLDRLQPSSSDREEHLLDRLATCRLLVLDDLGKERATDWRLERLYVLINRRYEACLPILVTSEKDPNELADHVGDSITRRVVELCEGGIYGPFRPRNQHTTTSKERAR